MSVFRTVSEIFSVKEWRDLEAGVGVVQGHTTFYWSAIVSIAVCCIPFSNYLTLNSHDLEKITENHSN